VLVVVFGCALWGVVFVVLFWCLPDLLLFFSFGTSLAFSHRQPRSDIEADLFLSFPLALDPAPEPSFPKMHHSLTIPQPGDSSELLFFLSFSGVHP